MMKRNCGTDSHKSPQARIPNEVASGLKQVGRGFQASTRCETSCGLWFLSHGTSFCSLVVICASIHNLSRSLVTTTTTSVTSGPVASSCTSS